MEQVKSISNQDELLNKRILLIKKLTINFVRVLQLLKNIASLLEADSQLNQEIFQQKNSVLDQNAPSFNQLFELSELRAQSQEKDTVIVKLKEQIKSLRGNVDDSLNKQLYVSIKTKNVFKQKEQCDALNQQVNICPGEISDLNAKLQEQGLVIAALKNELRKLKGKALDKEAIETHLLLIPTCLLIMWNHHAQILLNKGMLTLYIKLHLRKEALGPEGLANTRGHDKIQQTPSSNSKNKVEAHSRNVKSSLNKRNGTVKVNGSASVQNSKKHDNSDYVCINGDDCMSSDNLCVSNSMNDVKFRNACPLTRITTTNEVPFRKPIVLESESPKPVVNLVYSRKPRKNKNTESVSKTKVIKPISANKQDPSKSWGSTKTNVPSTSLTECRLSKSSSGSMERSTFLVIVDDYSRITWVNVLRSKDEAPAFIINFLKMIQVRLKETVHRIRTDNGTEFVNQTLRKYYEKVGISHETSEQIMELSLSRAKPTPSTPIVPPKIEGICCFNQEVASDQSSSSDVIHTIVHPDHQGSKHTENGLRIPLLENIIGALTGPVAVSTWTKLH
ncbi:retrovirus-related pol polyprotein from transposon TNT 1-94 [Tanacetum coccineum]